MFKPTRNDFQLACTVKAAAKAALALNATDLYASVAYAISKEVVYAFATHQRVDETRSDFVLTMCTFISTRK